MDIDLPDWDALDRFAIDLARGSEGRVWQTLAFSFVGDRPDLVVEAPPFTNEDADEITDTLIDLFGSLRPERLAVLWVNHFDLEDGSDLWAVRINSAEPAGPDRWRWRTRLHPYSVDRTTGAIEVGPPFDLDRPPDPWSQRLRWLYLQRTRRRLERRGWFAVPGPPDWFVAAHPDSTTLDGLERLAELDR
jgi:hypothetical protein